jgi:hypothetical protein
VVGELWERNRRRETKIKWERKKIFGEPMKERRRLVKKREEKEKNLVCYVSP